jgi:ANTAR domain/GAF domain
VQLAKSQRTHRYAAVMLPRGAVIPCTPTDRIVTVVDYREFSRRLAVIHAADDEEQTLQRVLAFALVALQCDMAGVMLVRGGRVESAAITNPIVREADLLQMQCNEGPCLSAIADDNVFRIDHTDADPRWPTWGPQAARIGIVSVLSVRMIDTDDSVVGSLNLYARRAAAFGPDDVEIASILTHHATVAYRQASRFAAATRAIDSRTTIGQAEGVLMERFGISPDRAFSVLRRYSSQYNVKLRAVARGIVETRQLPDEARVAGLPED